MANTQTLIAQAYSAFNQRNIDGVLALMSQNVSWPRASEGGRAVGKEEIRAYWTRQWFFPIARYGTFIPSQTVSSNAWISGKAKRAKRDTDSDGRTSSLSG
jgi:hypothetical protein